ncbi:MAG: hypothetical protein JXR66_08560 [Bacteroidales bacterium]|nr:hypothetical protein [Bacteroidales bacterium]MBN2633593.1 hypothetical protein [Bacteroidales bacterium]
MNRAIAIFLFIILLFQSVRLDSQTPVIHSYRTIVNIDYTHGQLPPAYGVHNIQIMRANREDPGWGSAPGWTYNHGPDMAYHDGKFYVDYLSNPVGEHTAPGRSCIQTSDDGYNWSLPRIVFPQYRIPDGTTKAGVEGIAKDLDAVMHHRIGFYVSKKNKRLYALGYYGICFTPRDKPNDGNGIGRVIREIHGNGAMGEVYFIRYNHGWNESNTSFPFYQSSKDKAFVHDCDDILADPLITMQWLEESDKNDPVVPGLNVRGQAFCWYTLDDGRLIGMWKSKLSGVSSDKGKTWSTGKTPGLYTASAKMWGQRTSDGMYAQVFNPSIYRWPMAVTVSEDGLEYKNLLLVHGEISPMRYSGNEKSYGPQYLRGIIPGNGTVPDGNMWLSYSVNKEDIWVMRVSVPVTGIAPEHINEDLSVYENLSRMTRWNIYSPLWAGVSIEKSPAGKNALLLSDEDRYDFAKAEHLFPESVKLLAEFTVIAGQTDHGLLNIELQNGSGNAGVRISFDPDGMIKSKRSYKYNNLIPYETGKIYRIRIEADTEDLSCRIKVNDREITQDFYAPVRSFSRIVFRTGEKFRVPTPDTPAYGNFVLEKGGEKTDMAKFYILSVKTGDLQ